MTVCNHLRGVELPAYDLRCTRPAGHDGEHQHHDGEAVCASWENETGVEVLREIVSVINTCAGGFGLDAAAVAVINTRAKVLGLDTATLATRSGIDQVELGNILTPGQALRFLRTSFGLDVDRVAYCAGVVPDLLRAVETDQTSMPPAWLGAVTETIMHLYEHGGDAA